MRVIAWAAIAALVVSTPHATAQGKARMLIAVWAHADDEGPIAPLPVRYAPQGCRDPHDHPGGSCEVAPVQPFFPPATRRTPIFDLFTLNILDK
jgi:hypothetical protein